MDFRHEDGMHLTVLLPPKSLLVMTKESRYIWSHGITPRKSDIVTDSDGKLTLTVRGVRTSLTFRKIIPPSDRVNREIPFKKTIRYIQMHKLFFFCFKHVILSKQCQIQNCFDLNNILLFVVE